MKLILALLVWCLSSTAFSQGSRVYSNLYSGTNVGTSAYVQLVSTAAQAPASGHLLICDTSGKFVKVAFGAANSEVDQFIAPVSTCAIVPIFITLGTRVSLKAVDSTVSSGEISVSFLP